MGNAHDALLSNAGAHEALHKLALEEKKGNQDRCD
jgi:hypothetical protein